MRPRATVSNGFMIDDDIIMQHKWAPLNLKGRGLGCQNLSPTGLLSDGYLVPLEVP